MYIPLLTLRVISCLTLVLSIMFLFVGPVTVATMLYYHRKHRWAFRVDNRPPHGVLFQCLHRVLLT